MFSPLFLLVGTFSRFAQYLSCPSCPRLGGIGSVYPYLHNVVIGIHDTKKTKTSGAGLATGYINQFGYGNALSPGDVEEGVMLLW
jgi:hypothetical protein